MLNAYIYAGLRTPFGRHGGGLAPVRPDDLVADVIRELIARNGIDGDGVDLDDHAAAPIPELLGRLAERVGPALDAAGDRDLVIDGLARVAEHGNGAGRQRRGGRVAAELQVGGDVVEQLVELVVAQHPRQACVAAG